MDLTPRERATSPWCWRGVGPWRVLSWTCFRTYFAVVSPSLQFVSHMNSVFFPTDSHLLRTWGPALAPLDLPMHHLLKMFLGLPHFPLAHWFRRESSQLGTNIVWLPPVGFGGEAILGYPVYSYWLLVCTVEHAAALWRKWQASEMYCYWDNWRTDPWLPALGRGRINTNCPQTGKCDSPKKGTHFVQPSDVTRQGEGAFLNCSHSIWTSCRWR